MVDLNVLKPSKVDTQPEESMEDLLQLIIQDSDTSGEDEMRHLEDNLTALYRLLYLDQKGEQFINDPVVQHIIASTEAIDIVKIRKSIVATTKNLAKDLAKFSSWVVSVVKTKTVTEKFITKRFQRLSDAIAKADTTKGFVKEVPTYDTIQKRLAGILSVCRYIKELSSKPAIDGGYSDAVFEKIALASAGVIKLTAPYSDTTYRNLEWNAPALGDYELFGSSWKTPANVQKIRNLVLQCKYDAMEDLGKAAKTLAVKCNSFQEPDEYNTPDYNSVANTYNAAYVVNKMNKQISKAINKELNTLMISYLSRLINYKTI